MTVEGMGPSCLAVEGTITATVLEAYDVERVLAPEFAGRTEIVVMDNLSAHKGKKVSGRSWSRGEAASFCTCHLPYSPDFNPIEEALAKIKGLLLRKAEARSRVRLWSRLWARLSQRSRLQTLAASSGTAGTAGRFNRYDKRCRRRVTCS